MGLPWPLVRFACGDELDRDEVTEQQQAFVLARSDRYDAAVPRAQGSKQWEIGAAFEAMKVCKTSLPATVEGLLRLRMVEGRAAEILGSLLAKAAIRQVGQRAVLMRRKAQGRYIGFRDGGFDDVFLTNPPYALAQQSFGGPHPDVATFPKQPKAAASCLITPEGGEERARAKKRQLEIWPELKGKAISLALFGFHKSSPGGPHFVTETNLPSERKPHRALSCLVHVVEPARINNDALVAHYRQLSGNGLVPLGGQLGRSLAGFRWTQIGSQILGKSPCRRGVPEFSERHTYMPVVRGSGYCALWMSAS